MLVEDLAGRHDLVAPLYGTSPGALQTRDEMLGADQVRLIAFHEGRAVGAATMLMRPDRRCFFDHVGDLTSLAALSDEAYRRYPPGIHASCSADDDLRLRSLLQAGFTVELTLDTFEAAIGPLLATLARVEAPPGYQFVSREDVDADDLYELDNHVRRRVPGSDGWHGNRAWFDRELNDPAVYVIAVDPDGIYAGLARIWRNPGQLRFGLVGVRRPSRSILLGPALIKSVLTKATKFGDHVVAETATSNRHIHPRLLRANAKRLGRRYQMVRR